MPYGDGTGPLGLGPMTGRGLGYCAGYNAPGFVFGPGWGRGRGWRRGWGRGFGWRFWGAPYWRAPYPQQYWKPTKEEEKTILQEELKALEEEMKAIEEERKAIQKKLAELK
ncbi:MAG: DUF5320 domain-containing protein [Candidatus Diapherotrites archaeon]|nr:DUF5320 domain-containing protein [Candidatus Diapherotrites archaeon]